MKIYENICYKDIILTDHMLDIYLPDTNSFPVFVYFHGGGMESGSKSDSKFFVELAERGIAVVSANYRLYPDAKFPEFIEDAAAAVAWAYKNMNAYGDVAGFFVGGSSAGGYLSQMLCFDKKYLGVYGIDSDSLSGYIHDAGQPTSHFNVLREKGIDNRRIIVDETAPLYYVTGDRKYAPMQIIVSDNDLPNRLEETYLLVSVLNHFGYDEKNLDFKVMKNSDHCSYVDEQTSDGKWVFAQMICEFILSKNNGINYTKLIDR